MHREIMAELRSIRAQMAATPPPSPRDRDRRDARDRARGRRVPMRCWKPIAPRSSSARSSRSSSTSFTTPSTAPSAKSLRCTARALTASEMAKVNGELGAVRRRHRTGHPADPRSRRGDRPGGDRAVQEHLAGPAEAAQRGNPGTRRLDLRSLQLPGSHRSAHQQGDDHDEVHRAAHQRDDGHLGRRRRHQGARARRSSTPAKATPSCSTARSSTATSATPRRTTSTRCSTRTSVPMHREPTALDSCSCTTNAGAHAGVFYSAGLSFSCRSGAARSAHRPCCRNGPRHPCR